MAHRTPRSRVAGLGTGGGTEEWWLQRVSSVALVPLSILFLVPFVRALGASHGQVVATYAHPFNALIAVLFLAVVFHHLKLGNQVVIEDYVSGKAWRTGLLMANTMFCAFFAFAGIFAVLKIAFSG